MAFKAASPTSTSTNVPSRSYRACTWSFARALLASLPSSTNQASVGRPCTNASPFPLPFALASRFAPPASPVSPAPLLPLPFPPPLRTTRTRAPERVSMRLAFSRDHTGSTSTSTFTHSSVCEASSTMLCASRITSGSPTSFKPSAIRRGHKSVCLTNSKNRTAARLFLGPPFPSPFPSPFAARGAIWSATSLEHDTTTTSFSDSHFCIKLFAFSRAAASPRRVTRASLPSCPPDTLTEQPERPSIACTLLFLIIAVAKSPFIPTSSASFLGRPTVAAFAACASATADSTALTAAATAPAVPRYVTFFDAPRSSTSR
mmetsp:Transcript_12183/g.28950  ORF Transcript_12183/g.28950 Transcript_12183/m.28950 type:complete len:317 (-) Transcript_12183:206-1156(-)